jgi:ferredoxin-nitrite reductase
VNAPRYGDGTVRLTVEQDVIFPFIPNERVEELKAEPIFQKYKIDAGNLTRGLVSCTGAQVGPPDARACAASTRKPSLVL